MFCDLDFLLICPQAEVCAVAHNCPAVCKFTVLLILFLKLNSNQSAKNKETATSLFYNDLRHLSLLKLAYYLLKRNVVVQIAREVAAAAGRRTAARAATAG